MKKILALIATLMLAPVAWSAGPPPGHGPYHHSSHSHYRPRPSAVHRQRVPPQVQLAQWYADEAHRQTVNAARMSCGYSGSRWTTDWHAHYRWALGESPARIHREIDRRDQGLAECRRQFVRSHHRHRRGPWR